MCGWLVRLARRPVPLTIHIANAPHTTKVDPQGSSAADSRVTFASHSDSISFDVAGRDEK